MENIIDKYIYQSEKAKVFSIMLEGHCSDELNLKCEDCYYKAPYTMAKYDEKGKLKQFYGCNIDKLQKDILLFLLKKESERIFL